MASNDSTLISSQSPVCAPYTSFCNGQKEGWSKALYLGKMQPNELNFGDFLNEHVLSSSIYNNNQSMVDFWFGGSEFNVVGYCKFWFWCLLTMWSVMDIVCITMSHRLYLASSNVISFLSSLKISYLPVQSAKQSYNTF